jgi:hypothetical protein
MENVEYAFGSVFKLWYERKQNENLSGNYYALRTIIMDLGVQDGVLSRLFRRL